MHAEAKQEFESLFDTYRANKCPNYSFEWKNTTNAIAIEPSHFICEGLLYCCSEEIGKVAHCILTLDKLIACSNFRAQNGADEVPKVKTGNYYLSLNNPILRKFTKDKKHGLRLVTSAKVQEFICSSKDDMLKWFECFKSVAVLENIKNHYQLKEVIGSGSSATVRIGTKTDTSESQEFAVKTIPKVNYTEKKHSLVKLAIKCRLTL